MTIKGGLGKQITEMAPILPKSAVYPTCKLLTAGAECRKSDQYIRKHFTVSKLGKSETEV